MKAIIDHNACIGCGLCVSECPVVFAMNDESLVTVIVDTVPAEEKERCRQAAGNCPVEAITIVE